MHVDSVATNAARKVVQPLDDVAAALKLDESDFAPVPWKAGDLQRQALLHPARRAPARLLLQQERHGAGRPRPREAADDERRVHGRPRDHEGQGHPGPLGEPLPVHRRSASRRSSTSSAARSSPTTASRSLWADEPGVKALTWFQDLVTKGYSPGQDRPGRRHRRPRRTARRPSTGTASGRSTPSRRSQGLEWGVAPLPNIGGTKAAWAGSHQFVLPTHAHARREQAGRGPRLPQLDQHEEPRVGQGRSGAGSQLGARVRRVQGPQGAGRSLATQIDDLHFPPTVAGIGDAMPEFDKAVNAAVLGGQDPQDGSLRRCRPGDEDPRGQREEVRRLTTWL